MSLLALGDPRMNTLRQRCAEDLIEMVAHGAEIRGYTEIPEHHILMARFLQGDEARWINRMKCLLGGRFLAKSWMLRQLVKFRWLRCPWTQIIVHSSNDKLARKFVTAIKEELWHDELTRMYVPSSTSSRYEFNLAGIRPEQGFSITAAGIKTSLTGSRCDLYAFDDPEPDTEPEGMRDRILQAFGEAGDILHSPYRHLAHMRDSDGVVLTEPPVPETFQLLVIGQPHCVNTAYFPTPEDMGPGGDGHALVDASYLIIPTVRGGFPLTSFDAWRWPEMMAKRYVDSRRKPMVPEQVRRMMPTSRWELQHCINPFFALTAGPVLMINEIEALTGKSTNPIMIVDPADSERGCEWGLAILGFRGERMHIDFLGGLQGEAYEGDDWESMGQSIWRRVFDLAYEFGVRNVYLETNLKAAASACRRYIAKNTVRCVVQEYQASRSKRLRIPEDLEQPINNRMVSAHPSVLADQENTRELKTLRWDRLPKPCDRLDALASGFRILSEDGRLYKRRRGVVDEREPVPKKKPRVGPRNTTFERIAAISQGPMERLRSRR